MLLFPSGPVSQLTEPVAAPRPEPAVMLERDKKIVACCHVFPIGVRADLSWRSSNLQSPVIPQPVGPVSPHPQRAILLDSRERLPTRCQHSPVISLYDLSR